MVLRTHDILLKSERLTLRPLTEVDWPILLQWNSDPEVLYYSEGDDVQAYSLEEIQAIYRSVSQNALCFMIEIEGRPVGECWLQRMNLERILSQYPGYDLRRIDLLIGEKSLWGQGIGTEAIRLLTELAFNREGADYVFAVDIADYNPRSRRAFQKNDYRMVARNPQESGSKAKVTFDLLAKNPRLGFHAYAIHLFFDPQTDTAIRKVWSELAESGVAPYLHGSGNRPHLTLAIYRALDLPEARRRLAELAASHAALTLSFQYQGIFTTPQPVIFLGPVVTRPMLELHAATNQTLDDLGELPNFDHYRPGRWIPHCGLATDFNGARLNEALEITQRLPLPLEGHIQEIGLVEMSPVRQWDQWKLGQAIEQPSTC